MTPTTTIADPVLRQFLTKITPLRNKIEKIILFGSRARGDEKPYSDYDILVVVPQKDMRLKRSIRDAAFDVFLSLGRDISVKVLSLADFERTSALPTPFMKNVLRDGVLIG